MYASLLVYMFSMCCLAVLTHFAGTETYLMILLVRLSPKLFMFASDMRRL